MKVTTAGYYTKLWDRINDFLPNLLVLASIIAPFCLLFILDADSFSRTWKGRTFYLFFLWLIFLEILLEWESINEKKMVLKSPRFLCIAAVAILPTFYLVAVNFLGLHQVLFDMVDWLGLPFAPIQMAGIRAQTMSKWILSVEYLVLTTLFTIIFWLAYHKDGLKIFSISLIFIGAIGTIYMIDTLYPYGYFTPLQAFVPLTASMASTVLNWLGYQTAFIGQQLGTPILQVSDSSGHILVTYGIAWPCAGVQSFLIFTFVLLIFFKKTTIPLLHRTTYFVFGAIVTFCVNILRIVAIYLIYIGSLSQGVEAANVAAMAFHDYYGGFLSMIWIMAYPLLIVGTRILWNRTRKPASQQRFTENIPVKDNDVSIAN